MQVCIAFFLEFRDSTDPGRNQFYNLEKIWMCTGTLFVFSYAVSTCTKSNVFILRHLIDPFRKLTALKCHINSCLVSINDYFNFDIIVTKIIYQCIHVVKTHFSNERNFRIDLKYNVMMIFFVHICFGGCNESRCPYNQSQYQFTSIFFLDHDVSFCFSVILNKFIIFYVKK